MIRRLEVPLLALVVGLACLAAVSPREAAPVRVLFIGNSYTYFHNLPEMVARLAAAAKHPVEARMAAPGGWRLKDHWEKGEARRALRQGRWDYVVLQDQSTLGVTLYVEGKARVASDELFRPSAKRWAAAITQAKARPVFYLTWARKASPEDQDTLTHAYMSAAKASSALVAPVGLAWQRVRRDHPRMELFEPDGSHPSPSGTYLAACTFIAALFDTNPAGLPATVTGTPVDLETGQVQAGKAAVLVKLAAGDASVLQQAAWDSWQAVKQRGGYVDVKPLAPAASVLPAPRPVPPGTLAGTWSGTLHIHPSGPIALTLRIEKAGAGWSGRLELKGEERESSTVSGLDAADGELRFALEKSAVIAGLPVSFRAVTVSPTELHGSAEAVGADPASPLRLVGTWRAAKR